MKEAKFFMGDEAGIATLSSVLERLEDQGFPSAEEFADSVRQVSEILRP